MVVHFALRSQAGHHHLCISSVVLRGESYLGFLFLTATAPTATAPIATAPTATAPIVTTLTILTRPTATLPRRRVVGPAPPVVVYSTHLWPKQQGLLVSLYEWTSSTSSLHRLASTQRQRSGRHLRR